MAQDRFWNWQDDDSTFRLNWRELGIFDPGRYRGFEVVGGFAAGLNLSLAHTTTGIAKTILGAASQTIFGVWYSRQGVVICENAPIVLPIAANGSPNPRIDLIVGFHEYIITAGGAAATYAVIQGTPSASPVEPALTLPNSQVILGRLFVPALMADLTDAGVVYTPASPPNYAGDATIAHTDREQEFLELQTFRGIQETIGTAFIDTVAVSSVLQLRNLANTADENGLNVYLLQGTSVPNFDYRVTAFANAPVPPSGKVRRVTIICSTFSLRFDAAFFGRNFFVKAGEAVTIVFDSSGNTYFEEGDAAALGRVNRFWRQQILNSKQTSTLSAGTPGLVTLTPDHNIYNLGNGASPLNYIDGMSASSNFDSGTGATSWGGGCVWLITGPTRMSIKPFNFALPSGYKPFWTPVVLPDYWVKGNSALMFVEDELFWRLAQPQNDWYDVPISITSTGAGSIAISGANILRVKFDGNTVHFRGFLTITVTGVVTAMDLNLALPFPFAAGQQSTTGLINSSPTTPLFVSAFGVGSVLRLQTSTTNFQTGLRVFSFTGSFEVNI